MHNYVGVEYGNKDNIRLKVMGGKEIKVSHFKSLERRERLHAVVRIREKVPFEQCFGEE